VGESVNQHSVGRNARRLALPLRWGYIALGQRGDIFGPTSTRTPNRNRDALAPNALDLPPHTLSVRSVHRQGYSGPPFRPLENLKEPTAPP